MIDMIVYIYMDVLIIVFISTIIFFILDYKISQLYLFPNFLGNF